MNFAPRPENDFARFMKTYFARCCAAWPKIRAIGGKWRFEDLIPGLSDFDTRLFVDDDTTPAEWAEMSLAVGRVHAAMARETPAWARKLEHLPGLNLTFAEVCDPVGYYPEFHHWTLYEGDAVRLDAIRAYLKSRQWGERDEAFHLKKFATYFGPYQRGIDPAVNLGPWENKYPLHSRYLHYFSPPVQAAVAIVRRGAVTGKLESLRAARELFPNPRVIDRIFETVERHYEIASDYDEPRLTELERSLEMYLVDVYREVARHVTLVKLDESDASPAKLREAVARIPLHPAQEFYDGVRFCRLMKGRLLFYAEPIQWFDTTFLIRNDLSRIVKSFYQIPLRAYGRGRFGERIEPDDVLSRVTGEIIDEADARGYRHFASVGSQPISDGAEKDHARRVAETLDPVLRVTEALGRDLRACLLN